MRTLSLMVLSALLATQTLATAAADKCHALVLSGGGNKGAYEAGTVYQLVHSLPGAEVAWDVVSGVSAGALNAGGITIFAKGNELEMADWIVNLWTTIETKDIWNEWPEGLLWGFVNESGIFDDTPLFNLLTKILTESPAGVQRKMIVSTVDTNSGAYLQFDENTPREEVPQAIISSASIPAVFPDQKYKGHVLMDGGTVWNTNLISAVEKCSSMGFAKSDIVVDISICGHSELKAVNETSNTISNLMRYWEIRKYYNSMDDILEYQEAEPEVDFRYLLVPSEPLAGGIHMLFFNHTVINHMIELGKSDVDHVLSLGAGKTFEMLRNWRETPHLANKYDHFHEYLYSAKNE